MRQHLSRPAFLTSALGSVVAADVLTAAAPASAATTVAVTQSAAPPRTVIRNGYVLTLDDTLADFPHADILIENGKIVAIAPNLQVADAKVIDAKNCIVMPGFIDSHRHQWEALMRNYFPDLSYANYFNFMINGIGPAYRPEDAYAADLISSLGALDAGITTMLDYSQISNSPEHTDAVIKALADSGIRAVYGYAPPVNGVAQWWDRPLRSKYPQDVYRLQKQYFASTDQLLTLMMAPQGPGQVPMEVVLPQWKLSREAGLRIITHAGSAGKSGFYEPYAKIAGFFGPDVTYVHCCSFTETEWKLVADSGGLVSISPGTEMPMGHGMTAIQPALDHGIRPSLSVDVETTEPGDFFTTIRLTLYLQRQLLNIRALNGEKNLPKWLNTREMLQLATIQGARVCGLEKKVGTLVPGKEADMIILRADRINMIPLNDATGAVALGMDTSNIDTVMVRGRIVKQNGKLVGVDMAKMNALASNSRDYVVSTAKKLTGFKG